MKGSVRVTTKKSSRRLQKGQATVISEKGLVKIENAGEETAYIIQVQIDNNA